MMNTSNASPILHPAFGRSSGRLALFLLAVGFFLATAWSGRVLSRSGAVVDTMETVGLFCRPGWQHPQDRVQSGG